VFVAVDEEREGILVSFNRAPDQSPVGFH
jgi:hypothetical protein